MMTTKMMEVLMVRCVIKHSRMDYGIDGDSEIHMILSDIQQSTYFNMLLNAGLEKPYMYEQFSHIFQRLNGYYDVEKWNGDDDAEYFKYDDVIREVLQSPHNTNPLWQNRSLPQLCELVWSDKVYAHEEHEDNAITKQRKRLGWINKLRRILFGKKEIFA